MWQQIKTVYIICNLAHGLNECCRARRRFVCVCVICRRRHDNDCAGGEWNTRRVYIFLAARPFGSERGRPLVRQLIPWCVWYVNLRRRSVPIFTAANTHSISHTRTALILLLWPQLCLFCASSIFSTKVQKQNRWGGCGRANIKRSVSDSSQIPRRLTAHHQFIYLLRHRECMRASAFLINWRQESTHLCVSKLAVFTGIKTRNISFCIFNYVCLLSK